MFSKLKALKSILVVIVLMFSFLVAMPNARAVTIVDFDSLDASAGFVSGSTLDEYLAGFGITISNVTGPSGPFVADATTAGGSLGGAPNLFTLPSSPNYLFHQVSNDPISYQLNFSTLLDSLSFTRPQTNAFLSPSGILVAPWSARALDNGGNTIGTVGEPQRSLFGVDPAVTFSFNVSGIAALVVERTVTNFIAGQNSVAIDNLEFTTVVPEPATVALLGIGLAGLAGGAVRRKLKKTKQK